MNQRFEKAKQRLAEAEHDDFDFNFMITVTWTNVIAADQFKPESESVKKYNLYRLLFVAFNILCISRATSSNWSSCTVQDSSVHPSSTCMTNLVGHHRDLYDLHSSVRSHKDKI